MTEKNVSYLFIRVRLEPFCLFRSAIGMAAQRKSSNLFASYLKPNKLREVVHLKDKSWRRVKK